MGNRLRNVRIVGISVALLASWPSWGADPVVPAPGTGAKEPTVAPAAGVEEEALLRYNEGLSHFDSGDYKLALIEFEKAYRLRPSYKLLYNIGRVYSQLNSYAKALTNLEKYLAEGATEIPEERRKAVEKEIANLRGKVAYISVDSNVDAAEIRIDSALIGKTPLRNYRLDAGDHLVTLSAEGYRPKSDQFTVAGREATTLTVPLQKESDKITRIEVKSAPVPAYIWVGWSVTGALAVGTLTTGLLSMSAGNDLEAAKKRKVSSAELQSLSDKKDNLLLATYIFGGAAVVAAGVSLTLTLLHSSEKPNAGDKTLPGDGSKEKKVQALGVWFEPQGIYFRGAF